MCCMRFNSLITALHWELLRMILRTEEEVLPHRARLMIPVAHRGHCKHVKYRWPMLSGGGGVYG